MMDFTVIRCHAKMCIDIGVTQTFVRMFLFLCCGKENTAASSKCHKARPFYKLKHLIVSLLASKEMVMSELFELSFLLLKGTVMTGIELPFPLLIGVVQHHVPIVAENRQDCARFFNQWVWVKIKRRLQSMLLRFHVWYLLLTHSQVGSSKGFRTCLGFADFCPAYPMLKARRYSRYSLSLSL